jgi:Spy/CpxP family protein refolding chaperone
MARQIGNQIQVLNQLHRAQNNAWEEALYAHDFDPKLAERRASELASTQAELAKLQFSVMTQIRQILTPEQALRFRELLDEERKRQNDAPPLVQPTPR